MRAKLGTYEEIAYLGHPGDRPPLVLVDVQWQSLAAPPSRFALTNLTGGAGGSKGALEQRIASAMSLPAASPLVPTLQSYETLLLNAYIRPTVTYPVAYSQPQSRDGSTKSYVLYWAMKPISVQAYEQTVLQPLMDRAKSGPAARQRPDPWPTPHE